MRVVQDINGNGEWDSGDLVKRLQPERVKFVESDGSREISTKVNWEIEIEVDPAAMFTPETQEQLIERLNSEEQRRREKAAEKQGGGNSQGSGGGGNHSH